MPNTKYPCTKCGKPHDSRFKVCLACRMVTCWKCGHQYAPRKPTPGKKPLCSSCLLKGGHYGRKARE
jgi:NMD protein affecting ribosome stability and mRNA decay